MVNRHEITKEQALSAVKNGEFGSEVIASKDRVVVIMTQDWCPQWHNMQGWVYKLPVEEDIDVHELVYNNKDFSEEFMHFKESQLNNHNIPYLRYYKDGKLIKETNYVSREEFQNILKG